MMVGELETLKNFWGTHKPSPDLPLEWVQLLDKLVDEPKKPATPVKR